MSDLKNDLKNVPYIKQFFGEYLDLRKDKDNEALIVESIRNGVEFSFSWRMQSSQSWVY